LHIAFIDNERDEGDEHDLTAEHDQCHSVERAHLGCRALAAELPQTDREFDVDDACDSILEVLVYVYPDAEDLNRALFHMLGRASIQTYQHPDPAFSRMVQRALSQDLIRVNDRYRPPPPPRDITTIPEVREAARDELMATAEADCALNRCLTECFGGPQTERATHDTEGVSREAYDSNIAAIRDRITAIRHTNAVLAKHGLPPQHPRELRQQLLSRLLSEHPTCRVCRTYPCTDKSGICDRGGCGSLKESFQRVDARLSALRASEEQEP
jgi:hypothetical protein